MMGIPLKLSQFYMIFTMKCEAALPLQALLSIDLSPRISPINIYHGKPEGDSAHFTLASN